MAKVIKSTPNPTREGRKAKSPESREQQMIALAENLAEQQLRDGTASSQVIVHYLKLGTTRAMLEKEKLRKETALIQAKESSMKSIDEARKIAEDAIRAMRGYQGLGEPDEYDY